MQVLPFSVCLASVEIPEAFEGSLRVVYLQRIWSSSPRSPATACSNTKSHPSELPLNLSYPTLSFACHIIVSLCTQLSKLSVFLPYQAVPQAKKMDTSKLGCKEYDELAAYIVRSASPQQPVITLKLSDERYQAMGEDDYCWRKNLLYVLVLAKMIEVCSINH